eukprot:scaffold362_cov176-Amphora_coffeaeformis.AAC.46
MNIFYTAFCLISLASIECRGFHLHSRPTSWQISRLPRHRLSASNDGVHDDSVSGDKDETNELIQLGRQELERHFRFPLDDWQLHAGGAICKGYNVIVCAPTGAGKTVIGEMALHHAFLAEQNGIYTTPLKALSNQKYSELCEIFGRTNTGLSTGDISINKGARITIMTTEVYRNIAWRSSTPSASIMGTEELISNAVVVLDEFHYMGYPGRGGVWEESIITSPAHTQIVGLSATLANGQAIAKWMESVTGKRTCLVDVPSENRPVPLRYLFATKEGLFPLFRDPDAGPGSPRGLLGYRGEGKPVKETNRGGGRSIKETKDSENTPDKLPKGLQVNPALRAAAERRMQKVNRSLERKRVGFTPREGNDRFEGAGRRSRPVIMGPRKMSPREERRERERLLKNEMRRAVPSIAALLRRLDQKDLLPAIFFIFSRAGCEQAARNVYETMKGPRDPTALLDEEFDQFGVEDTRPKRNTRKRGRRRGPFVEDGDGRTFRSRSNYIDEDVLASLMEDDSVSAMNEDEFDESSPLSPVNWEYYAKAGLLTYHQIKDVASRISNFNDRNPEIEFDDDMIEQFLFGVGSHHAGMLPAHKSFVEILYRNQLMKAVFATETLAAGINMPARTTVICAMAKRGDGSSMNLLETSNLLQMAGRAGRRGFDTEGTCVIVATPFETHDDASKILTDPIKPIRSQFSPSYSLSVNLIARGEGQLDVARQLVSKSFAMWEKRQVEERVNAALETHGEGLSEVMRVSTQEHFMNTVQETLQVQVDRRRSKFDIARIQSLLEILDDKEELKRTSKSYLSTTKMLELEECTLGYLNAELQNMNKDEMEDAIYAELVDEDRTALLEQIQEQEGRVALLQKEIRKHPFSTITNIANEIMMEDTPEGEVLFDILRSAKEGPADGAMPLTATELSTFAKSTIVARRKTRKLASANPDLDPQSLIKEVDQAESIKDGSWDDMLAIIKTLLAYGCIETPEGIPDNRDSWEKATYSITPAGVNVGMLGFENSLWALVAMGGAWDVIGASSNLDRYHKAMEAFESDEDGDLWYDNLSGKEATSDVKDTDEAPVAQQEAEKLLSLIRTMTPAELAGYVAAIVAESSRGSGPSVVELFHGLTQLQQRVVQASLQSLERLSEVQKLNNVDPGTRQTNLDISNVEVVTAWADGCTWNEALRLSGGLPPGDLARTLSRVLDAVRQLGNLPFTPVRKEDMQNDENVRRPSRGIHPDVRRLCRNAAAAINRYPLKDPFSFEDGNSDDSGNEEGVSEDEDVEETVAVETSAEAT